MFVEIPGDARIFWCFRGTAIARYFLHTSNFDPADDYPSQKQCVARINLLRCLNGAMQDMLTFAISRRVIIYCTWMAPLKTHIERALERSHGPYRPYGDMLNVDYLSQAGDNSPFSSGQFNCAGKFKHRCFFFVEITWTVILEAAFSSCSLKRGREQGSLKRK